MIVDRKKEEKKECQMREKEKKFLLFSMSLCKNKGFFHILGSSTFSRILRNVQLLWI